MNDNEKVNRIRKVLKIVKEKNFSVYKIAQGTGLNQSGLNRWVNDKLEFTGIIPNTTTIDLVLQFLEEGEEKEISHLNREIDKYDRLQGLYYRIESLKKEKKISNRILGEPIDLKESAVRTRLKNRSFTDLQIKLICQKFEISPNWLRTGQGDMESSLKEGEPRIETEIEMLRMEVKYWQNQAQRLEESWKESESLVIKLKRIIDDKLS